jgi:hypothetical protein
LTTTLSRFFQVSVCGYDRKAYTELTARILGTWVDQLTLCANIAGGAEADVRAIHYFTVTIAVTKSRIASCFLF